MPRGGYRKPPARTGPSGPGAHSRRTDGQAIREPDIDDPDLNYGDRTMMTEAQKLVPIPRAGGPARSGAPLPTGQPTRQGGLPSWLLDAPSSFPGEPVTAGLPMGPGPGPEGLSLQTPPDDIREQTLMYLANNYGNADAQMILSQLREERARAAMPMTPLSGGPPGSSPTPSTMNAGPSAAPAAQPTAAPAPGAPA